jgi:hypothetical protein
LINRSPELRRTAGVVRQGPHSGDFNGRGSGRRVQADQPDRHHQRANNFTQHGISPQLQGKTIAGNSTVTTPQHNPQEQLM